MNSKNLVKLNSSFTEDDFHWMKVAINYARHGIGLTGKNPSVGCVIVKNNQICGIGRTSNSGRPHAEENALLISGSKSKGATLYVTLEPCAHYEEFTPCTKKILSASIKKVVIASNDPDPRTNGQGIEYLKSNGIDVKNGCLENEAEELIQGFKKRMVFKKPFVTIKIASSIDSKIALSNGKSKWITGPNTRRLMHLYRLRSDAILTGVNTVNEDNPQLNCRLSGLKKYSPKIFVLDSKLKIKLNSKILKNKNLTIITSENLNEENKNLLKEKKIDIKILKTDTTGLISIKSIISYLTSLKINNLLIEGGKKINTSFISSKYVDKLILCRSGILFGEDSKSFFSYAGLKKIPKNKNFILKASLKVDDDIIEHWIVND